MNDEGSTHTKLCCWVCGFHFFFLLLLFFLFCFALFSHLLFLVDDAGAVLLAGTHAGDKNKMCRLWTHEVLRVFGDRLIDDEDREWLFNIIQETTKSEFKLGVDAVFERIKPASGKLSFHSLGSLMFGDFADLEANERVYDELEDLDALTDVRPCMRCFALLAHSVV